MTPEEQQIAIAEHSGWSDCRMEERTYGLSSPRLFCYGIKPGDQSRSRVSVPNYLNDLNAMHEAEKTLTDEQRRIYGMELGSVIVAKMRAEGCRTAKEFDARPTWLWEATASQRAEAFLRTIGKYKSK